MSKVIARVRDGYAYLVVQKMKIRRFRHETLISAMHEAKHLAEMKPGAAFLVLQEHSRYLVPRNPVVAPARLDEPADPPSSRQGSAGSPETSQQRDNRLLADDHRQRGPAHD